MDDVSIETLKVGIGLVICLFPIWILCIFAIIYKDKRSLKIGNIYRPESSSKYPNKEIESGKHDIRVIWVQYPKVGFEYVNGGRDSICSMSEDDLKYEYDLLKHIDDEGGGDSK